MQTFGIATDAERAALAPMISHTFGFPAADAPSWFERAGYENLRAHREGGLAGGLIVVPMGQYFGGRSVPMTGVAGVGVAPEHRGRGAGTRMMRALVRELYDAGVALSALYPATVPLYQRAGYERAGARYVTAVRPHDLSPAHDPALTVSHVEALGDDAMRALYARFARDRDGWLDRGPYLWRRLARPHKGEPRAHAIHGPDGLEGYAVILHGVTDGHDTEVTVSDLVAVTPRAMREAFALLAGYRSLAREVRWYGAPHDAFTQSLRERFHTVKLADFWMLRLCHVERALASRGYNPSLRGALTLHVTDDVIAENSGAFRLEVDGGEGRVMRAAGDGIAVDVRALAAMYTGLRRASSLARDGLAHGDAGALALADALFASEGPAMSDGF